MFSIFWFFRPSARGSSPAGGGVCAWTAISGAAQAHASRTRDRADQGDGEDIGRRVGRKVEGMRNCRWDPSRVRVGARRSTAWFGSPAQARQNAPMNDKKTLLLVDGSSYLYRAFHAMPDLRAVPGDASSPA